ncbi:DUF2157 domain-containing protein [Campylobacter concisus]|uniref:DUF2157 domain-containing protein n=1 Tax=Campylobacter concisus TaxID=199 RepID=A0A7S9RTP4_9BACT|nr:DUF2157 domain-containing protein [Campylobacter concisus]QPH97724.1 DUF2157 domain-containing protein [Campylobacter concisus]
MNFYNRNFLAKELDRWQKEDVIDKATALKIANLYDIDLNAHSEKTSFILKLVAYLFFALAFFTLVGANWEEMPRLMRLVLVLFTLGLVNFGGVYYLKNGKDKLGTAMLFLGNFCYGAAIALIAQIYNISDEPSGGVLLWSVGAMALSFASKKALLVAQSIVFATIWFVLKGMGGEFAYEFIVFIALGAYMLYKSDSAFLAIVLLADIFFYIVSLCAKISGFNEFYGYDDLMFRAPMAATLSLSYALLLVALFSTLAGFRDRLAHLVKGFGKYLGIVILIVCLIAYANGDIYELEEDKFWFAKAFFYSSFGKVFAVFSIASIALFFKEKNKSGLLLGLILFALPFVFSLGVGYANIFFSLANIIVAAALIKNGELTLGLCMIFLVAVVRYFELIGDYLGATALFIVFAFVVLAVAAKKGRTK